MQITVRDKLIQREFILLWRTIRFHTQGHRWSCINIKPLIPHLRPMKEFSFNIHVTYWHQTVNLYTGLLSSSTLKQNLIALKICIIHLKHEKKSLATLPKTQSCVEHKQRDFFSACYQCETILVSFLI